MPVFVYPVFFLKRPSRKSCCDDIFINCFLLHTSTVVLHFPFYSPPGPLSRVSIPFTAFSTREHPSPPRGQAPRLLHVLCSPPLIVSDLCSWLFGPLHHTSVRAVATLPVQTLYKARFSSLVSPQTYQLHTLCTSPVSCVLSFQVLYRIHKKPSQDGISSAFRP